MAQPLTLKIASTRSIAAVLVAALALICSVALRMQWLPSAWAGVLPYLLPLELLAGGGLPDGRI